MKTYKFLQYAGIAALIGATLGCTNNELVQESILPQSKPITIQATASQAASRILYNEEESVMTMTWEESDMLKVIAASTSSSTDFILTDGAGTSSAKFEGIPTTPYADGEKLYALYHNNLVDSTDIDTDGNVVITLKEQDGTLNDDYHLMFGETSYKEGVGMQNVDLETLVSILKLTIPTDKTLTKVTLNNNQFRSKATLILQNTPSNATNFSFQPGDLVYCYDDDNIKTEDGGSIDAGNGEVSVIGNFEPVNGEVTVYFYVLQAQRYRPTDNWLETPWITFSFSAIDTEGKIYINAKDFENKETKQGKMYRINSGIFSIVDFENEDSADGTAEHPYEIANSDQLYSFMFRVRNDNKNKQGYYYNNLHYKLTNDIHLDGSVDWRQMNFWGTLDGCGHSISGPIKNSMFNCLWDATIKNLVLDADITEKFSGNINYGSLAYIASNSTLVNCINKSDFTTSSYNIGGLVGSLEYNSKMIGCANMNNITTLIDWGSDQCIGGLVGTLYETATIESCYCTGTINIPQNTDGLIYIGGLAGAINLNGNVENPGLMTGCWTSTNYVAGEEVTNATIGDIAGYGTNGKDYIECYKVENTPSSDEITNMNNALNDIGSTYRFNADGIPVLNTTSN